MVSGCSLGGASSDIPGGANAHDWKTGNRRAFPGKSVKANGGGERGSTRNNKRKKDKRAVLDVGGSIHSLMRLGVIREYMLVTGAC